MARVPFLDANDPQLKEAMTRVFAVRGQNPSALKQGGHRWKLYGVLLHSPPVAEGWSHLITAVRKKITVPKVDQELALLLMTVITKSPFQYNTHVPMALAAGLTQRQIDAIANWRDSKEFNERERAVLAYADAMTCTVEVPDQVFEGVRALYDSRQLVELTALIAAYNFTMRFAVAMQMGE